MFKPSSKNGDGNPSACEYSAHTASSAGQPLSYAEFVVQSKRQAPPPATGVPERGALPRPAVAGEAARPEPDSRGESSGDPIGSTEPAKPQGKAAEAETRAPLEEEQRGGHRSEAGTNNAPKPLGTGSSVVVSLRQVRISCQNGEAIFLPRFKLSVFNFEVLLKCFHSCGALNCESVTVLCYFTL